MAGVPDSLEERVLVLVPTRRDADLTRSVLDRAGVACLCCADLTQVCLEAEIGAGALLLAEESMAPGQGLLAVWLGGQPPWSDLPVLVLARPGADSAEVARAMDSLGNVTVLERPTRVAALVSAVRTALRARQRQYEARAHLSQIEQSERDLRDFFDNATVGLHWVGPDGIVLRVNQTELDMLGYAREEYVGRHIADFHADRAVIDDILACLWRGETVREREARLLCKDGSIKHVLINSNVLWDGDRFVHTRSFTRDVTERKRAEEAQAQLAAIVAFSDDAIISKSLDGVIQSWNDGAQRVFGYSAAEAIGQPITLLIPPERQLEEALILSRLRAGERMEHFETVRISKDGRRIDVSLRVSPIRNTAGTIIGASKVARDITARKRAEQELRQSEERFRLAQSVARIGTFEWNMQTGVNIWTQELEAMYGLAPGAFDKAQATWETLVHPEDRAAATARVAEAVRTGEPTEHEWRVVWPDGSVHWIAGRFQCFKDAAGKPLRLSGVNIDVTERRQMEEALREADRRKDEFLAVLAHELRNPLAPIRNSLHILRMTSQHDPAAERVGAMIERQVNHMVRLVDDLMEVSRITRGKIELRKEPVEVAAIVRSAVETSRPHLEAAGHQLALAIPPEPLTLDGDPVRLTQVVANLLNNAAKYTDPGGQIWLTVRREGDHVAIAVKDTGAGIPPDMLPRVFELFTQLERHASRSQGGLGIGLTLVKSLVEMHGGAIQATSEGTGRGSEFVVRLPLAAHPDHALSPAPDRDPARVLLPRRVLVVDDNRDAAESLSMLLKLLGADVDVAYDGRDALVAIATHRPTVVLLDLGMPGMDGYELARRIRQKPEYRDVTLIALTGWGQDEDRRRSQDAGFDYHLIKPAELDALQTLLRSLEARPEA